VNHGTLVIVGSLALAVFNVVGIRKLQVENCFINYFKPNTEIYQGMKVVDRQLGGTTPLDVVIDLEPTAPAQATPPAASPAAADSGSVFDQFDDLEQRTPESKQKYWFTPQKLARIATAHDYLDALPETGKVLSVVTLVRMVERATGKPLDNLELALLFDKLPARLKEILVTPYVSVANDQVRLAVRIRDSDPGLQRDKLLKKIRADLTGPRTPQALRTMSRPWEPLRPEQVHLAGTLVLYNNMLQSLYTSQIATMGFAALFLMGAFVVLFRSVRVALIAIFPNLLAISCVLGVMGWLHIPLDMMTITIAAIAVGLAVDDTIHYIHRFRHEIQTCGSYRTALHRSHNSIGHAMYYTSVTLIIGFSILSLSNFIPTVYFGLLTVLAMTAASLASLILVPELLVVIKPYGREGSLFAPAKPSWWRLFSKREGEKPIRCGMGILPMQHRQDGDLKRGTSRSGAQVRAGHPEPEARPNHQENGS
jgi:predicted RND superfamily exporter protein